MSPSVDNALLDLDQAKSQEVQNNMFGYFSNRTFSNVGDCVYVMVLSAIHQG
jgi:hypothetical protein